DSGAEPDLVGATGDDADANTYAFAEDAASSVTIDADVLTTILDVGTDVTLQAHDDITVDEAIISTGSGGLTLQAGDDVFINQNITTVDGFVTIIANDAGATEVAPDGTGDITMADTIAISTGAGAVSLSAEGDITVETITTTGAVNLTSTAGAIIEEVTNDDGLVTGGSVSLSAATSVGTGGAIDVDTSVLSIDAGTDFAVVVETGTDLTSLSIDSALAGTTRSITADNFTFSITDDGSDFTIAQVQKTGGANLAFDFTAADGGIVIANTAGAIDTDTAGGGSGNVTLTTAAATGTITEAADGNTIIVTPNGSVVTLVAGSGATGDIGGDTATEAISVTATQLVLDSGGNQNIVSTASLTDLSMIIRDDSAATLEVSAA
ncbi:MAG: hypothetical protein ACE37D_20190, partial [Pseudomonadales bacterium]